MAPSKPIAPEPPIVAIGASAGGLEACRHLLDAMPPSTGLAFILIQHLDPTHDSLLVELLATHTALTVVQAAEGMVVAAEHLYVIPPGSALSVRRGALRLSPPAQRHGARLPFDFLLQSLASERGAQAMAVVLSGTGEDGSVGAMAIHAAGGYVVVQDPGEAGFDGMPRATIATGAAAAILPVAEIPAALLEHASHPAIVGDDHLPRILDLLRARTAHDFGLYKPGTLGRRIARRMALVGSPDLVAYARLLEQDDVEIALLAKDLLIHVTRFFRDPEVFALLSEKVIPGLVAAQPAGHPLRVWVAGCSTGAETWSLAVLFREAILAAGQDIRLQIFASDVEPDAVGAARQALYPASIAEDVSADRLQRFFEREDGGWRVRAELRALVVFTVQDVLSDPPFSRLDFVSCRNLLIYLRPEAQARTIALFHFALRPGGILLLGGAETLGPGEDGFEPVGKAERIWRRTTHARTRQQGMLLPGANGVWPAPRPPVAMRQSHLAELCRRLVLEHQAPASVLIDGRNQCIQSLGPTDRYLTHVPGAPSHDLLAMARPALRTRLRVAIRQARDGGQPVLPVDGPSAGLAVYPVPGEGDALLLVCFIDRPGGTRAARPHVPAPRLANMERELEATRAELRGAIQNLEQSGEEQRAVHEEALSVNEEYQSTNEELLTSKEELQSLNEELTALNGQLQETLERSRTTSNDLQNVLYSADVATLFLDPELRIRFFTPATRAVFSVLASDVGRPLADLRSLATDAALLEDAAAVLTGATPPIQEVTTSAGTWFSRRVLPYRAQDGAVAGVVITFADITDRRVVARALEEATRIAEQANAAKSRFLGAASHDLRQPLQTLTLLQGLLAREVMDVEAAKLVALMEPTLAAMSGMLNTLLDINQIEAGTLRPEPVVVPVGPLLARLADEFGYLAQSQGLALRLVPCSLSIRTDPQLLEQMLRNLLSNALKYTRRGKVLLGCRRRAGKLAIEVWDSGIGIPAKDIQAIFDEYHQLDNAARERSKGLGLGLSIVRRLAGLLGHRLAVRSTPGRGSVFAIEADLAKPARTAPTPPVLVSRPAPGTLLVVEDDPDVRDLLMLLLQAEGHVVVAAADAKAALEVITRGAVHPDLILADFNLPKGMDGLQLGAALRERLRRSVPVIILTGDISTDTLRKIAAGDCALLHKPVKPADLVALVHRLLPATTPLPARAGAVLHVVDDDAQLRATFRRVLEKDGHVVQDHASGEAFLAAYRPHGDACLLLDAKLPGMSGLDLLTHLRAAGDAIPVLMITGYSDVPAAVAAIHAGASDFIEKPVHRANLLAGIARATEQARDQGQRATWRQDAVDRIARLTDRQREVMGRVLAGEASKNIAADLGISQRTVETHRAAVMRRTGTQSLPGLARLALAASDGALPSAAE